MEGSEAKPTENVRLPINTNRSVKATKSTAMQPGKTVLNLPNEVRNEQKRRSSSRSIKRKRFDDEIVEYSVNFPQSRGDHRVGRPRTTAHTYATPPPPPPPSVAKPLPQYSSTESKPITSDPIVPSTFAPQQPVAVSPVSAPVLPTHQSLPLYTERRRYQRSTGRKSRKSGRPPNQSTHKDLGRWKPIDDLALIIGILQTNDLRMIHRGTKFSCKFTVQELQSRWFSLLYEPAISRTAVAAMRNLHPEVVEIVQRNALFSSKEEELLATFKSTDIPKLDQFQELLDKNSSVFYCSRTAKILQKHWQMMKQYQLLPDQVVKELSSGDQPLSFSDAEDLILDAELGDQRNEVLETELSLNDRHNKRQIRLLENELCRWNVLVDSITNVGKAPEFDGQTLAVLRGRLVRYLMRSKEITFGRDAKDSVVDVDLSLEGSATKISRRQGTIKLRSNGDFFIANEGKRPIFINGVPLLTGNKNRLANNCVVEISGLRFVFLVNYELINAIRHESAKTTTSLN